MYVVLQELTYSTNKVWKPSDFFEGIFKYGTNIFDLIVSCFFDMSETLSIHLLFWCYFEYRTCYFQFIQMLFWVPEYTY